MIEKIRVFLIYLFVIPLVALFFFVVSPYIPETFTGQNFLIFILLMIVIFSTIYKHLHEG
ncbi:MAG: hypothetical protein QXW35_02810 [Candidatus Aenigmatarchaeota archaeon]